LHSELAFDHYAILADQWMRGEIGVRRNHPNQQSHHRSGRASTNEAATASSESMKVLVHRRWKSAQVVTRATVFGCFALTMIACRSDPKQPIDDAKAAGLTAADFPQASADIFRGMDGGIKLEADEIEGRNTWILWTAGNQVFWDRLAREGYGIVDLIKTLDSRERPRRFAEMGLINEPGFRQATHPDNNGLWLDEPTDQARAAADERIYGRGSGVIGFRIYPNPDFDEASRKNWDPARYYNDPAYYTDRRLVRPYRVGVTCGSCHVAPNPLSPPADPENPRWEDLSSAIGNQYLREGRVFSREKPGSFLWEMLNAQPPGTSDTSRVANDHINNPNAINAIFLLGVRMAEGTEERMVGGAVALAGGEKRRVPHILKDGADSVGVAGAVLRVYVNEGMFSQQFLADHDLLLGLRKQQPFSVTNAFENSVFWQATYDRTANIAKFFARLGPTHLEDAPGGRDFITTDQTVMDRGRVVFAENCAGCHSSKQPSGGVDPRSEEARQWYRASVMSPDFRDHNFLSTDKRIPVSELKTNACRALATNATAGHIWDNFSSASYKALRSVGPIETYNPIDEASPYRFNSPEGGPGYYRPPSLIAMWSSAPFLHNNSTGIFTGDPSVSGRMRAFDDAIVKLLWPEKRLGTASIWRTTRETYLKIPASYVPELLSPLIKDGFLGIGPIPEGLPINLLANIDPTSPKIITLIPAINAALLEVSLKNLNLLQTHPAAAQPEATTRLLRALMHASQCPDLIEDRGHEYGARLSDSDKRALIEFLKTL
jgi:hypothetical protein